LILSDAADAYYYHPQRPEDVLQFIKQVGYLPNSHAEVETKVRIFIDPRHDCLSKVICGIVRMKMNCLKTVYMKYADKSVKESYKREADALRDFCDRIISFTSFREPGIRSEVEVLYKEMMK
jgi:hypothetical protein